MELRLKGGKYTQDRRLDRVAQFDERSRKFPIRELVGAKPPRSYTWRCSKTLDQGREGACVGFGWAHELIARPKEWLEADDAFARRLYRLAQTLDEWPGENYSGTSVLAGAKATQELLGLKEYRWAFGLDDLILALGYSGPAVLGLNWYQGMYSPDEKGFLRPEGSLLGGHCLIARGVSIRGEYVTLRNSWGLDWGMNGDCKISFADLDRLLREDGEACIPVVRT